MSDFKCFVNSMSRVCSKYERHVVVKFAARKSQRIGVDALNTMVVKGRRALHDIELPYFEDGTRVPWRRKHQLGERSPTQREDELLGKRICGCEHRIFVPQHRLVLAIERQVEERELPTDTLYDGRRVCHVELPAVGCRPVDDIGR